MKPFILILALLVTSKSGAFAQNLSFSEAVKSLCFGVDISKLEATTIVKSFERIPQLVHTVSKGNKDSSTSQIQWHHSFKFQSASIANTNLPHGTIDVYIIEDNHIEQVTDISWSTNFETKEEAEKKYKQLINVFKPLSTSSKLNSNNSNSKSISFRNVNEKLIDFIILIFYRTNPSSTKYTITARFDNYFN